MLDHLDSVGNVSQAACPLRVLALAVTAAFLNPLLNPIWNVCFALAHQITADGSAFMFKAVADVNVIVRVFHRDGKNRLALPNDLTGVIAVHHVAGWVQTKGGLVSKVSPKILGDMMIQRQGRYLAAFMATNRTGTCGGGDSTTSVVVFH